MIRCVILDTPYQATFTDGTHTGQADVPIEKGGHGHGFGPHNLLEAALATCLTMTARMYAEQHQLPLDGVRAMVRIDRTVPGETTLHYAVEFEGDVTPEQFHQLRDAVGRCPVASTLTGKLILRPS